VAVGEVVIAQGQAALVELMMRILPEEEVPLIRLEPLGQMEGLARVEVEVAQARLEEREAHRPEEEEEDVGLMLRMAGPEVGVKSESILYRGSYDTRCSY
jgi:hypothetical protein